ncbi:glycoside hydrolase family 13 protein [Alkalicoccobacillus murimartini]|uniref:Alpha-amylase n=1 Tax=Alkalicoccobacillus murimartini TaxID=171685 RepID=A0ABT9YM60_9BACI|nr:alpha-glucosidase [Alkalicoccobacillus murimartini]MDQ0208826.1 alpha-glucosidase [Alkalicoccobacillus murimartini]
MNKQWWKEAVCYQVYPRSFYDQNGDGIGDLKGVIEKLDYLKWMGIDVIWMSPMYDSPNDDNGYDIRDYKAIMDEFGTMEDFNQLLEEVHLRGMKIIIDLVINHTSDEHEWFVESRSSITSEKRDWYIWRDAKEDGSEPNNWASIFNGSAWEWDEQTKQYYLHIFSKKQPDVNWENKDVRDVLYETMNWWLDKGIDGFRVDAISHIKKIEGLPDLPNETSDPFVESFDGHMNRPGIQTFLQEMKQETLDHYDVMTVGEANGVSMEDPDDVRAWVGENDGVFDMVFQFEHLGLWNKDAEQKLDVPALKEALTKWQYGLEGLGWNALFIENHDQPRSVSSWGNDTNYWEACAKALGTLYFFMKGTPFIYQGQEIGMTNVQFPAIEDYDDVSMRNYYEQERSKGRPHAELMEVIWSQGRDNSRTPMQWTNEKNGGFSTANQTWLKVNPNFKDINVQSQLEDKTSILAYYKTMIELRKHSETLIYGAYELCELNDEQVYMYKRCGDEETYTIIVNLSEESKEIDYTNPGECVLGNYEDYKANQLLPFEARVYKS